MDAGGRLFSTYRFLCLFLLCFLGSACSRRLSLACTNVEWKALLTLKESLIDPSGRLSSWVGEDCCNWTGIGCSNRTGRVVKLDLRNQFKFSKFDDGEKAAYNSSCLGGDINPCLLNLKHLNYLDLSMNDFRGNEIPKFLGSLKNLRYLNLSFSSFSGLIPSHLGNLSNLLYLDLHAFSFSNLQVSKASKLQVESLQWLGGFSSLKHLNLGNVNLSTAGSYWLQDVHMIPSLVELHFPFCGLLNLPLSISTVNFTKLSVLDLSYNEISSPIPHWMSNLTSLTKLDLAYNSLGGVIPDAFVNLISLQELDFSANYVEGQLPASLGYLHKLRRLDLGWNTVTGRIPRTFGSLCNLLILNLVANNISGDIEFVGDLSRCASSALESLLLGENKLLTGNLPEALGELKKLRYLYLFGNSFWGSIPASIGSLSSLQTLDLSRNHMNGTIPESIGQLLMLETLDLSWNFWQGIITAAHFHNLTNLKRLELYQLDSTDKPLVLDVKHDWVPPFSLTSAGLGNMKYGQTFPPWLENQYELEHLWLENLGISGTIPIGLWNSSSKIMHLSLSNNNLEGKVPQFLGFPKASYIDLSFNNLEGPLPILPSTLEVLSLYNNNFSGPIPKNIGELVPSLSYLDLSSNSINGGVPSSIRKLQHLVVLAMKNNLLSGELPWHWENLQSLRVLDISNNSLSGKVPPTIGFLSSLELFSLSHNNIEGDLPSSLRNCTRLISLDLGGNQLSGKLPTWLGESMPSLRRLSLRSNLFRGDIPRQVCLLSKLQFLTLAHNTLSGLIPPCLGNLSKEVTPATDSSSFYDNMVVVSKGRELQYDKTLYLVHSLDLSGNNLSGEIPDNITTLLGLGIVNLSMNHLTGRIPANIGNLCQLETLDLSRNQLSGLIPESLSSLTFLSHLNLSYNNLSGKIPSGNQLQTLNDSTIYAGNPLLCGSPLVTKCPGDDTYQRPNSTDGNGEDMDADSERLQFYIAMVVGFIVGFWAVCGTLITVASWRIAFFRFIDDVKDWLAVLISVNVTRLQRKLNMAKN